MGSCPQAEIHADEEYQPSKHRPPTQILTNRYPHKISRSTQSPDVTLLRPFKSPVAGCAGAAASRFSKSTSIGSDEDPPGNLNTRAHHSSTFDSARRAVSTALSRATLVTAIRRTLGIPDRSRHARPDFPPHLPTSSI
ncbi:hypothetical protein Tdes44962_MAKER09730 [Teratosphaeria destructans]|uniref:Uncharacterized protein n=1 Tax=Teratosphaeria destructans TaxID=418781 RepID=A0A9W7SRQ6_9PEZI|nr:hypothetical protein Tdes44962_MAKER09730 [Teratosphaeria destructans]